MLHLCIPLDRPKLRVYLSVEHSVAESDASSRVTITMTNRAWENVIVEVTISDGSANGNVE